MTKLLLYCTTQTQIQILMEVFEKPGDNEIRHTNDVTCFHGTKLRYLSPIITYLSHVG